MQPEKALIPDYLPSGRAGSADRGGDHGRKAPRTLSLAELDTNLPFSWQEQLKLFGMA